MIAIVTDSTACLTKQDARTLGVIYVPITYSVEAVTKDEDYVDECGDFAALIREAETLHTSQATSGAFLRTFAFLRRKAHQILCLTLSSRLSGTYNNALACAKELGDENIRVIDSQTTAGGLLLLATHARHRINQGATLDETADEIQRLSKKVRMRFSVEDMAPLRNSGRLGPVRQSVSTILNIRPILSCENGRLVAEKLVRGSGERLRELINAVPENARQVVVMNYECGADDARLYDAVRAKCACPVLQRGIGPSLAIHVGEGAVGVAWLDAE